MTRNYTDLMKALSEVYAGLIAKDGVLTIAAKTDVELRSLRRQVETLLHAAIARMESDMSDIQTLRAEREALKDILRDIVSLSAGWDANGSTGPRPPLSWEDVARFAMDMARTELSHRDSARVRGER